jgi:hypothetical protein
MLPAVVTGSRKYGKPGKKSDVDLVILITYEDMQLLSQFATEVQEADEYYSHTGVLGLTFGKLHLLCVTSEEEYRIWVEGTEKLFAATRNKKAGNRYKDGVSRDLSILFFERLRELRGYKKDISLAAVAKEMDQEEPEEEDEPQTEVDEDELEEEEDSELSDSESDLKRGDRVVLVYTKPIKGDPARGTVLDVNKSKRSAHVLWEHGGTSTRLWRELRHDKGGRR